MVIQTSIAGAMPTLLKSLGVTNPVLAAPMAGGPSTVELVVDAGRAGSLGFLAAGYKDAALLAEQIASVRQAGVTFGVNLFAPNPIPVSPQEFRTYSRLIQLEADVYGIDLGAADVLEDDDSWDDKVTFLLEDPVPVVSFTFGIPPRKTIAAFKRVGTATVQTVTSALEAQQAAEAGVDLLVVQASAAGGHSATLDPRGLPDAVPLPELIRRVRTSVAKPVIGAGGIGTAADVAAAIAAGSGSVLVGTALLRAVESGASATHKAAIAEASRCATVVTRAFTGRPARALRNAFTDKYTDVAPVGYPAVHHLTSALRRVAAAAGDPDRMHLWAGAGFAEATAEPAREILNRLASDV